MNKNMTLVFGPLYERFKYVDLLYFCLKICVELIFLFALWLRRYATILSINETLLVLIPKI
jgi:hypothetical protein